MIRDKGILIRNIYYMLTYAFQELRKNNFDDIAKEDFDQILELFAEILYKGVSLQLKQGLYKEYVNCHEILPVLKGRLDIEDTINCMIQHKSLLGCDYDELSEDNIFNQIIKSTILLLIRSNNLRHKYKKGLRSILPFFGNVHELNLMTVKWKLLRFQRNNQNYRMLMNICYFIVDGVLMTTQKGEFKMATFTDEHMNKLFERFVLEYYRKHHKYLKANSDMVEWDIYDTESAVVDFLPSMKTDISLHNGDKTLIIDTKYYGSMTQTQFGKSTIHSGNMYQIFTYVKNKDCDNSGNVSGMLLYAKTEEETVPELDVVIGKNRFLVKTLDLNQRFDEISKQLDLIVSLYFT